MAKKKRRSRKKRSRKLIHETLEQRQLLAGDMLASWQNAANPLDVNDDEVVSPLDALAFAAEWGRTGPGPLDAPSADAGLPMMYVDVDGDGALTERDFDALVAYLENPRQPSNAMGYVMGEGEGSSSGSGSNSVPVAVNDAYSTSVNTPLSVGEPDSGVLANDEDYDGDTLAAQLESNVANGTLTLCSDGTFDYVPPLDWSGQATFTYRAFDGTAPSEMATVTIDVMPNQAPIADAGGPYLIRYGDTLYLDGHNSYDPDYGPNSLSYAWDLNEDGTPDVNGPTPDIEWSVLESTYGYTI